MSDSYKVSHWKQYPSGTQYVYSYFESRGCDRLGWDSTCFFGLQYFLKRYLVGQVVTQAKIDEAAKLYAEHFGSKDLFNRDGWEYILQNHGGKLPVKIKAVPEGMVLPFRTVLMTIENTDPKCFWLTNFLETLLVQVWYPMAVCTNSRHQKVTIQKYLEETGHNDWSSMGGCGLKLHDFGFRGVSSVESAAIGGLGHLVNFLGTDTVAAMICAQKYYGAAEAAGMSIPAAEHSTITSWGVEGEVEAMRNILQQYPSGVVACVSDSYDVFRACRWYWGQELKALVKGRFNDENFGRLVIRPDSGDPAEICLEIVRILCDQYQEDVTLTATGHKLLPPYLRIIQGDGIDWQTVPQILQKFKDEGFAADNLVFGSGGALLQKLNRDTFKCALKCSEVIANGEVREVFKDPITDMGKASKKGRLTLQLASSITEFSEDDVYRPREAAGGIKGGTGFLHFSADGKYVTVASGKGDPEKDLMVNVFQDGELLREWELQEIRERADLPLGPFCQKSLETPDLNDSIQHPVTKDACPQSEAKEVPQSSEFEQDPLLSSNCAESDGVLEPSNPEVTCSCALDAPEMTNAVARDVAISKDTQEPAQIQGSEKQTCEIDVPPVHHDEYSCSTDQVCVTDDYSSNKTSHDTVEPDDTNDNETLICEVYVPVMSVVDPSLLCAPNPESEGTTKSLESPGGDAAQPSLPPAAMAGMSEHEKPVPAVMPDGGDILAPTGSMGVCAVSPPVECTGATETLVSDARYDTEVAPGTSQVQDSQDITPAPFQEFLVQAKPVTSTKVLSARVDTGDAGYPVQADNGATGRSTSSEAHAAPSTIGIVEVPASYPVQANNLVTAMPTTSEADAKPSATGILEAPAGYPVQANNLVTAMPATSEASATGTVEVPAGYPVQANNGVNAMSTPSEAHTNPSTTGIVEVPAAPAARSVMDLLASPRPGQPAPPSMPFSQPVLKSVSPSAPHAAQTVAQGSQRLAAQMTSPKASQADKLVASIHAPPGGECAPAATNVQPYTGNQQRFLQQAVQSAPPLQQRTMPSFAFRGHTTADPLSASYRHAPGSGRPSFVASPPQSVHAGVASGPVGFNGPLSPGSVQVSAARPSFFVAARSPVRAVSPLPIFAGSVRASVRASSPTPPILTVQPFSHRQVPVRRPSMCVNPRSPRVL